MASSGGIKGFYKHKKNTGVSKPSKAYGKKRGGSGGGTAALIAHGSYDLDNEYGEEETKLRRFDMDMRYGEEETKLRRFDMDMRYGPCVGITRLHRWERADSMGLNPPEEIERILRFNNKQQLVECLWERLV